MTPLKFASEVESVVKAKDADIDFVGFKRTKQLGHKVIVLTCLKNDQVFECRVDWHLVELSLYPDTFIALTASEVLCDFAALPVGKG